MYSLFENRKLRSQLRRRLMLQRLGLLLCQQTKLLVQRLLCVQVLKVLYEIVSPRLSIMESKSNRSCRIEVSPTKRLPLKPLCVLQGHQTLGRLDCFSYESTAANEVDHPHTFKHVRQTPEFSHPRFALSNFGADGLLAKVQSGASWPGCTAQECANG